MDWKPAAGRQTWLPKCPRNDGGMKTSSLDCSSSWQTSLMELNTGNRTLTLSHSLCWGLIFSSALPSAPKKECRTSPTKGCMSLQISVKLTPNNLLDLWTAERILLTIMTEFSAELLLKPPLKQRVYAVHWNLNLEPILFSAIYQSHILVDKNLQTEGQTYDDWHMFLTYSLFLSVVLCLVIFVLLVQCNVNRIRLSWI